jgi:hypothetical protein
MCCVLHWHKWSVPVPGRLEIESPFCSEGAVGGEGLTMSKGLDRFSWWRKSALRILREFEEKGALHAPRDEQRKMNSFGGCQAVASGTSPQRSLLDRNPPQQFEVAENLAGAQHHAAQRVVSDAYRQPRFFPDSPVQVFQ